MEKMLKKIKKALSAIDLVVLWICGICIAVMAVYSFIDVLGRFLFNKPLYGTYELSGEILVVIVIFFSLAPCESEGRHMRVDFIFPYIHQRMKLLIDCISYACGILVCSMLIATTIGPTLDSWKVGEFTQGIVAFPVYPAKIAIIVGLSLFVIRLIVNLMGSITDLITDSIKPKTVGPDISHASDQI
jgi:TRAP-type transport system small permease protein